jgi:3'-phosphoadenosine 5'-phosphosulfate sulfotransferase (PAPS reductase)/FAD synthetase
MRKPLETKVKNTIALIREIYSKIESGYPFIAFSTGKDSLAMTAMIYEAIEPDKLPCLYVHHNLEFPENLDYAKEMKARGFMVEVLNPFLEYFELTERGIGFLTLIDAWCVPMLVGTGFLDWLKQKGVRSSKEGVMFRGMSGSEYSHKFHGIVELYKRLDLPCFNPLLDFTRQEIIEVIKERYGLPLNPIYEHMSRTYCICCYTSDKQRQTYSEKYYPQVCERYYRHIERLLFDSGLLDKSSLLPEHKTKEEKLQRHGFVYWRRQKAQEVVGAIKRRLSPDILVYLIRNVDWIADKHLKPVDGKWARIGNEIRFWNIPEKFADILIKRMINCLDCGFCMVECFSCRQFDRATKSMRNEGCIQCGKCIKLKFCMGWRHRFWRRIIVDDS